MVCLGELADLYVKEVENIFIYSLNALFMGSQKIRVGKLGALSPRKLAPPPIGLSLTIS